MRRRLCGDHGMKIGNVLLKATTKELTQGLVQRLNQSRSWELVNTVFADNALNVFDRKSRDGRSVLLAG